VTTELHPDASALALYRPVGEDGREYTAAEGTRPMMDHALRVARAVGYIGTPAEGEPYAILDVRDDADDTVQDFPIPTARAFRWWYRRLGARLIRDTP
jgi:hypothetical protein